MVFNVKALAVTSLLLVPFGPFTPQTQAAETAPSKQNMEEVIVSASPLYKTHSDNTRPAAVLTGDQLRTQAAATLGETLQGQLGVSAASFGPGVGTPVIRGQQGNRVKVMQNNLDTLDAANASGDHANATEALLADRIEVLRGPQTLRYGNGAIGGIINVLDNRIPEQSQTHTRGALELRHNSVNDETASLFRLDGGSKVEASHDWAWHIDGLYRDSNLVDIDGSADVHGPDQHGDNRDGFIENSDSQASAGTVGLSRIGDHGFFGLSVNVMKNQYGIPPGGHTHDDEDEEEESPESIRIDMRQTRYDFKAGFDQPIAGIESLKLRLGHVDYEHSEIENGIPGTLFESDATEARLELIHAPLGNWQGVFGVQALHRDFAAIGDEAFIPQSDTRTYGLFVVEERYLDQWLIELGARLEHQSIDPGTPDSTNTSQSHNTASFSAGGQYRLSEQHRLNLVVSRSQRAPSIEELYSNGAHLATQSFERGDNNLEPETSHNLELGYRFHRESTSSSQGLEVDINLFYNDISDFIYRRNTNIEDADEALTIFQYDQQDARFKGIEAQVRLPLSPQLALRLFIDRVRAELKDNGDIPRITPPRLGAELQYDHRDWHVQLRLTDVAEQNQPGEFEEITDGYTRLDIQLNYTLNWQGREALLFAKGQNLLDEEIRNASSFLRDVAPEAGRGISAGIRFSF